MDRILRIGYNSILCVPVYCKSNAKQSFVCDVAKIFDVLLDPSVSHFRSPHLQRRHVLCPWAILLVVIDLVFNDR